MLPGLCGDISKRTHSWVTGRTQSRAGGKGVKTEVKQFAQGQTTHTKHLIPEPTFSAII